MERNKMANRTTAVISEEEFIMEPYIDWCFKELMRNPNTRRGFIAELLELSPEQIGNTIILENELPKRSEEEKKGVLDVHVLLENGTQLDIEMQVVYMEYWDDRSLFYLCKMFSSQLCKGEEYDRLQKCVHVSVLNFTYYKKDDICYRKAQVYDKATGELYSDKLELQILELPKIPEEYHHPDGIIAWMKFFRGGKKEDLKEMAKGNTYLEEAYEDLMEMSQDEEKRRAYEARERALRDQLSLQRQAERAFQRMTNAQEKLEEIQGKLDETQGKLDLPGHLAGPAPDGGSVQGDGPPGGAQHAADGPQCSGLARAVGPQQGHDLSLFHVQVNAPHRLNGAVIHREAPHFQQRHTHTPSLTPR